MYKNIDKSIDKSVLISQIVQLVNQANQLLVAVAEYTGETASIEAPEVKPEAPKYRAEPKEIVTIKEASEILGRSKYAIYGLVHRGQLAKQGSGRICYFKRSDLLEFMQSNKRASSEELSDRADALLNKRGK